MKRLLLVILFFSSYLANAQYNALQGTLSNKPYTPAQAVPTDGRTYYYDTVTTKWRPYISTTEVLNWLTLAKYRTGQFDIVINTGGTLSSGTITGGSNAVWYFKDGTADNNLVLKSTVTTRLPYDSITGKPSNFTTTYAMSGDATDSIQSRIRKSDSSNYVTPYQASQTYVTLQTQYPTAVLYGGVAQERLPVGGSLTYTLSWQAGRLAGTFSAAATKPLSAVNINGVAQSFTQPNVGSSATDSYTANFSRNTTATYYLDVTTTDNKTTSATTTFTFYDKRYVGWATTATPTNAEILAAINQDNNGGTVAYSTTLAQLGTAAYLFYINTSTISSVTVNGFPSTAAFSLNNSISVTNASGATVAYKLTISNAAIGATSSTTLSIN